jgi:hypothetical protein
MNRQTPMEGSAARMVAFASLLVIAVILGLSPFDGTTLFWVGALSLWVLR